MNKAKIIPGGRVRKNDSKLEMKNLQGNKKQKRSKTKKIF